ncbi:MAG TPA: hypothetical protein VG984_03475 [Candidatus Paceibacterota bacterium]|nr:hypothetical protein [Candidatus Paceibacterota bacterium]
MADDAKQEIEKRLAELPEDVRNAVLSADLGKKVQVIGQAHRLHIDQIGKLEDETMLVMLGFFDPEQFNIQLEQQLLIPAADANAIAGEINTNIFLPIRESLKRFMLEKEPATPTMSAAVTPPVPAIQTPPPMPAIQTPPPMPQVSSVPSTIASAPQPAAPVIPNADAGLTQPAVVKPNSYKNDPYREPIE